MTFVELTERVAKTCADPVGVISSMAYLNPYDWPELSDEHSQMVVDHAVMLYRRLLPKPQPAPYPFEDTDYRAQAGPNGP